MRAEDVYKNVAAVEKVLIAVQEQVKQIFDALQALEDADNESIKALTAFRIRYGEVAVSMKKDIDELRRWAEKNGVSDVRLQVEVLKDNVKKLEAGQERAGARAWSVVPNLIGAMVSGVIAATVAFLVAKYGK